MASTAQDEIYRAFLAASGQQMAAIGDATGMLAGAIAQLGDVSVPAVAVASKTPITTAAPDNGSLNQAFLAVSGQQTPAIRDANPVLNETTPRRDSVSTNEAFLAVSGQQTAAIGDTKTMLADVLAQLREVRSSVPTEAAVNKTPTSTTSQDGGITAGSVASTVLKSGFGLAPLIGGLVSLFTGGDAEAPAPLVKYALPAAIDFQAAQSNGRVTDLDYDQAGLPRTYAEGASGGGASTNINAAAPQITVNVQAMDARSFLDRSNDIALAVRDAMLNLNAINDVVNEL